MNPRTLATCRNLAGWRLNTESDAGSDIVLYMAQLSLSARAYHCTRSVLLVSSCAISESIHKQALH